MAGHGEARLGKSGDSWDDTQRHAFHMSWADLWKRLNEPSRLFILVCGGLALAGVIGVASGDYSQEGWAMVIIWGTQFVVQSIRYRARRA